MQQNKSRAVEMSHRLSPQAEIDLDDIWHYLATASGNVELADRLVDTITERFYLLSRSPHIGRRRDQDLRVGLRSFPAGQYIIIYRVEQEDVLILSVLSGKRDVQTLFG